MSRFDDWQKVNEERKKLERDLNKLDKKIDKVEKEIKKGGTKKPTPKPKEN